MHIPQINRRALLIALAQAGEHTPERAQQIRWMPEEVLWPELHTWRLPVEALQAAHPAALRPANHAFDDIAVQARVSTHLQALGLPPATVHYLTADDLRSLPPMHVAWQAPLRAVPHWWTYPGLPHVTARMLLLSDEPAWQPLVALIEDGYRPLGLHQDRFLIYDPEAP